MYSEVNVSKRWYLRAVWVALLVTGMGVIAVWAGGSPRRLLAALQHPADFDALIRCLAASVALVLCAWFLFAIVGVLAAHLAAAASRTPRRLLLGIAAVLDRVTPRVIRRLARAALGATLALGPVAGYSTPSWAVPSAPPGATSGSVAADAGSFTLDWPAAPSDRWPTVPSGSPRSLPRLDDLSRDVHVVVPGDTLWDIAGKYLAARDGGHPPSAAAIAKEWPRWYAANRVIIGGDPNLLFPGERLQPPTES